MQAQGIEFGSHTITHPMLSQVPLDVARREIGESKRMLEDRLGTSALLLLPSGRPQRSGEAHRPRRGLSGGLLDPTRPQRPPDRPLRIEADVYQPPRLPGGVRQEDGGRLRPLAASPDRLAAPAPSLNVAGRYPAAPRDRRPRERFARERPARWTESEPCRAGESSGARCRADPRRSHPRCVAPRHFPGSRTHRCSAGVRRIDDADLYGADGGGQGVPTSRFPRDGTAFRRQGPA